MSKEQILEILQNKSLKELQALLEISTEFTPDQLDKLASKIPANKNLILTYLIKKR